MRSEGHGEKTKHNNNNYIPADGRNNTFCKQELGRKEREEEPELEHRGGDSIT